MALEHDDFGNAAYWPHFRDACRAEGILPGVWFTDGANMRNTPADARFTIGEIEGPADYEGVVASIPYLPPIPRAVVTNYSGLVVKLLNGVTDIPASQAKARPLIDAGFECLPEVYIRTDDGRPTGVTPISQAAVAEQLGWGRSAPVFGVFGGALSSDYSDWRYWPGWSDYVVELTLS